MESVINNFKKPFSKLAHGQYYDDRKEYCSLSNLCLLADIACALADFDAESSSTRNEKVTYQLRNGSNMYIEKRAGEANRCESLVNISNLGSKEIRTDRNGDGNMQQPQNLSSANQKYYRRPRTSYFVQFLREMVECKAFQPYIRWSDDGSTFHIINPPEKFEKCVLQNFPKYKTNKFNSIVRQLNMHNFKKVIGQRNHCPNFSTYKNPYFIRSRPNLQKLIKVKRPERSDENITK
ncbi:uncharacterized protein TRIADDRAFT_54813 [Trichoplax adhaerens]|uniref:HSF-type DNA-binding domain-containing protein n=1 Tax=Trichoplax adhaerens TaxID=10228 RepID=B3RT27_TRIAD|nr:hypothetical protein TRIADDRAFT_54813 [Trichoplax adhaerens]EDV27155.1 hypothetical protein TRIADDRAFT_54813 [Trichoplax adhaerens]|eukprot:XP_002111151.1 hypothetical protein TRIADDRAFT_54813 [Trichoplax adhaerens]